MKFQLGELYMTPGVMGWIEPDQQNRLMKIHGALQRYVYGDWGSLDSEDIEANNEALEQGMRLMGSYHVGAEEELWIITNGDRSGTTILWPSEY